MKLQRLLPLSATLFIGMAAMPALAGTSSVTNSFSTRDIKNGWSKTNIDVHEHYKFWREGGSDATKSEWGVTVVTDNLNASKPTSYKGKPQRPSGDSSTFYELDVYEAEASSWSYEKGDGHKTTDVTVEEAYDFTGFDKTHTVSSGFSF